MGNSIFGSPVEAIRRSFSRKLAALFLLVLLLIAGVGGVIYVQTGATLQEDTERTMQRSTALQAATVGEWVDGTRARTRHVSGSDRVAGDPPEVEAYLRDEQRNSSAAVAAIHYYNMADHEVLASTADGAAGTDYGDVAAGWTSDALSFEDAHDTAVTHPYDDPATGTDAIAFLSPVPDDPDRAIALIVDLGARTQQLERPSATDGSFTHVVDSRGTVVMSHHRDDIGTQNMGSDDEYAVESEAVARGLDGETDYVEMEVGHGHEDRMAMGFAPVPGTDWVIMTHVPAESAFALQGEIERSVIGLVVLSVLGLGAVGAVIVRNTTRPIERLAERAADLEDGNLDAELESDRTDEIGRLYDAFDGMRASLRERIREVEEARTRADRLNRHLETKADEYADVMQACGEGDLTRRMDPEGENEAMTEIAVEFNRMVAEIEETVDRVSRFADEVAASSEEVTASTEEVRSASVQVAGSVQEISDGAQRQTEHLRTVTEEMDELSTTTEQIAASSDAVADLAERTAETGTEGRAVASEVLEEMNEVEADAERTVDAIESLEEEMERIDELVEFIADVAKQTNLLALNANIEATRSTAAEGDGFSAVAGEVKELAEETGEAAGDIEERIERIKAEADRTTDEVRRTGERIASHRRAVENTVAVLEEIAEYAEETSDGVQEISAATQQQAASTQEAVSMVDRAASIAEETTAEAESVAAASEEQTTALAEVSGSVEDLSRQAAELSSKLDEFETGDGSDDATPAGDEDVAFSFAEQDDQPSEPNDRERDSRETEPKRDSREADPGREIQNAE